MVLFINLCKYQLVHNYYFIKDVLLIFESISVAILFLIFKLFIVANINTPTRLWRFNGSTK